jgi:hypothetical protein
VRLIAFGSRSTHNRIFGNRHGVLAFWCPENWALPFHLLPPLFQHPFFFANLKFPWSFYCFFLDFGRGRGMEGQPPATATYMVLSAISTALKSTWNELLSSAKFGYYVLERTWNSLNVLLGSSTKWIEVCRLYVWPVFQWGIKVW